MSRPLAMSTSTPPYAPPAIRAITAPLVTRAAPPIPCAEALYVPLAQRVLRRRLTHKIFLHTLLYSLVHAWAWLFFHPNNTHNNFTAMSVLRWLGMGFSGWMCGVLPVLLVRKAFLTVTHTSVSSPFAPPAKLFCHPRFAHPDPAHAPSIRVLRAQRPGAARDARRQHVALCALAETPLDTAPPRSSSSEVHKRCSPRSTLPLALPLLMLLVPVLRWLPLSPLPLARALQSKFKTPSPTPRIHTGGMCRGPLYFLLSSLSDDDRAAVSSATLRGCRCCRGAAALSPPRTRFLSAAQVHTPQTRFLHPKVLIASGAGAFRDAGSQCGGMAVGRSSYTNSRAFFLHRPVLAWRGTGCVGRGWLRRGAAWGIS
ncbi:hypothetical protein C8J57DRAFT_1721618 [Mycena rebaudengoi]|nr:hypothetical protein C8J57DRAFT_1721618 [Mycena rebaudengoi]